MRVSEQIKNTYSLQQALSDYGIHIPALKGKSVKIRCPFPAHNDNDASFTVWADGSNFNCFSCCVCPEGSVIDLVAGIEGISDSEAIKRLADKVLPKDIKLEKKTFDWKNIIETRKHFYQDELGNEIIRKEVYKDANGNKMATPYNIVGVDRDNKTKENKGLNGLKYPIYRLPAAIKAIANNELIFLTEGEKDAESLDKIGIYSATVGGATSKWMPEHLSRFPKGYEVVVLIDNDESGRRYGNETASTFVKCGHNVKMINLADYESRMGNKADVTNWIELGHKAEELVDIVGKVDYWALAKDKPENTKGYNDWRDNYKKFSDYVINENGQLCRIVWKYDKDVGKPMPNEIKLSNFIARISKDISRDDGQEQKALFEIEGFLSNGRALPTITIESNKFIVMNWIIENWGSDTILSPGAGCKDYLRHAIQLVSQHDKERQTVFNYTGWRNIHNKWVYLHAGGAIGVDGVTVDLSNEGNLSKYELPTIGSEIESAKMALKLLDVAEYKITIPLLSLVYLSPLCEPLRKAGHEPDFVGWVQGMTQSMKSSLSAVILNHFGKGFTKNTMPASFKDTYVYTDRKGFLLKDSLLVIDDFHPSTSKIESQKMHSMAQKILRAWGDRIGRGRGNVDGTIRQTYPPRGMCLVTGEDLPEVGQSGMARYFLIKIKRGDINKAKLTELQNNTHLLAQNMTNYINWLSPQIDDIANSASYSFRTLRDTFTQCHNLDGRMPEMLSFLLLGLDMFLKYTESIGVITKDQHNEIFNNGQNALIELSCSHAENIKAEQPVSQFLKALNVMIETEQVAIINIGDVPKEGIATVGYREVGSECYYLIPDATYTALVQFYNKQDSKFPVGKSILWQHLANDGHVECGKVNGKETPTKGKKIHKKNGRYIWLKISSLNIEEED